MATTTDDLTLEQYAALDEPDDGFVSDLVRGRLVREPTPGRLHGRVRFRIGQLLSNWIDEHGRGEVTGECPHVIGREDLILGTCPAGRSSC